MKLRNEFPAGHISFSSLSNFETCPRCWWLNYVEHKWPPKNKHLILGKKVHEDIGKFITKGEFNLEKKDTLQFVAAFKKIYPEPTFISVEQEFLIPFVNPLTGEDLPLPIKGFIDWIDENHFVHDIKTSSRPYSQFRVDESHQLSMYAYAHRFFYDEPERGVVFDVLLKNVTPICKPCVSFRTDEKIAETWNWAQDILFQIDRQLGEGIPESHTENCWNPDFEK